MEASTIGALLAGVALAFALAAIWYGLRGLNDVFDLATANKEMDA